MSARDEWPDHRAPGVLVVTEPWREYSEEEMRAWCAPHRGMTPRRDLEEDFIVDVRSVDDRYRGRRVKRRVKTREIGRCRS